jgi:hypothetical protein
MATRSPYNDRYKVDQKGQTRRSASASKPKRAIADLTPSDSPKKAVPKKKLWGLAPAAGRAPAFAPTPKMKQLRKIWWALWGASLLIALVIVLWGQPGSPYAAYVSFAWGLWGAAMAGAFYLEFGPIRKARAAAMEAARKGGKPSKAEGDKKGGPASKNGAAGDTGGTPESGDK